MITKKFKLSKNITCTVALLILSTTVFAQEFIVNGVKYLVTSSVAPYTAVVTRSDYSGIVAIRSSVYKDGITYSVTGINGSAFSGCTELVTVQIDNGVKAIGDNAFYGCAKLANVIIPSSVNSIGNGAFYGCTSLESITLPSMVEFFGEQVFSGCAMLNSVILPHNLTSIPYATFFGCKKLETCLIRSGITSIARAAFYECESLTSVTVPEGVTEIGMQAFIRCEKMQCVSLPSTLCDISSMAFAGCTKIESIFCDAENPPRIDYTTFNDVRRSTPVYVPDGSVFTYSHTAYWEEFFIKSKEEVPVIETMADEASVVSVHNLAGLPVSIKSPQIKIVTYSDGTVKKIR